DAGASAGPDRAAADRATARSIGSSTVSLDRNDGGCGPGTVDARVFGAVDRVASPHGEREQIHLRRDPVAAQRRIQNPIRKGKHDISVTPRAGLPTMRPYADTTRRTLVRPGAITQTG